jgi:hypothetical protein
MKSNGLKKTLDIQHNNKLNDFQKRQSKLEDMKKELIDNEQKMRKIEDFRRNSELSDEVLNDYLKLQDDKHALEKNIHNLERSCDEVDYYTNTASLLFRYYDIVEKGIEDNNSTKIKDKSILKYFFTPNSNQNEPTAEEQKLFKNNDRATLLDKYMSYSDPNYLKNIETECNDFCFNCQSNNRSIILNDGLIFCNECHTVEYVIVDHERPSYRDPPKLSLGAKVILWLVALSW